MARGGWWSAAAWIALALTCASPARGGPPVKRLRMAAIAPEGTAWARELRGLTRDVELHTSGQVSLKWYLGGIAGDEIQELERLQAGQLDGIAGALFCERLAPSLRVQRVIGLFQNRDEARYVTSQLRGTLDAEFEAHDTINLGVAGFGSEILFSRLPISSMADLKRTRLWVWALDVMWPPLMRALRMTPVPLSVEQAAHAYDEGQVDGFVAVPTAALAYQWSARAKYFTPLSIAHLPGCLVVRKSVYQALPISAQTELRSAAARFIVRFEDLGRTQDDQLIGSLFEKQGLQRVTPAPGFVAEFFEAATRARDQNIKALLPEGLLERVMRGLADYRAERVTR